MHHPVIHHHLAAVGLPDALMPEADAHDRQLAGEVLDDIDRQACLARGAGAGGDEDALRFVGFDLFKVDLVVSMHQHVRLQLAQVLDEVECERIVVVEDENHRQAKYNSESAWPSGVLKLELHIAQAGGDFVDYTILVGFVAGGEGDAETNRRLGVVPRHGGDEFLADQPLRERFAIFKFHPLSIRFHGCLGRAHVEEKRAAGFVDLKAGALQHAHQLVHAARVFGCDRFGDFWMIVAVSRGVLDREKLAGVGVVLHVAVSLHEQRVANDEPATPTGHVEIFACGVQFDPDVFRARRGKKTERLVAVINQPDVGSIVNDDEIIGLGELDHLGEKLRRGTGAGWVVRVIEHEHLGFLEHVGLDAVEIRQIIVLRCQREVVHLPAEVFGVCAEYRIARNGHDDIVARVDECCRQDGERGLAADRVQHLGVGVDFADAAYLVEEVRGGDLQGLAAVVGVASVFRFLSLLMEFVHHLREGHLVRFAHSHVDDLRAGIGIESRLFGALDLLKLINGRVFTVVDSTNAFREKVLNVAV